MQVARKLLIFGCRIENANGIYIICKATERTGPKQDEASKLLFSISIRVFGLNLFLLTFKCHDWQLGELLKGAQRKRGYCNNTPDSK